MTRKQTPGRFKGRAGKYFGSVPVHDYWILLEQLSKICFVTGVVGHDFCYRSGILAGINVK